MAEEFSTETNETENTTENNGTDNSNDTENNEATVQKTYSYNPLLITAKGVDQMRFELGDTIIEGEGITSALCNEEYQAMIETHSSWKKAKLACLEAILMRFSYEVNTSTDGLSYSLSDRYDRWKAMYEEYKKKCHVPVPRVNPQALNGPRGKAGGPSYFYPDLLTNPRKQY